MWSAEPRLYLLPWTAFVALIALVPLLREARRPTFDPFSPLPYAILFHVIPAFVIGGLIVSAGFNIWYLYFIPDPERVFPLTMFYTGIGYAALTFGFMLPWGRQLGARIGRLLPQTQWRADEVVWPALAMLAGSALLTLSALRSGLVGFQVAETVGTFDAAVVMIGGTLSATAAVLLWLALFRDQQQLRLIRLALLPLIAWIILDVVISGRRGALMQSILVAAGAFWLSGRRIRLRHLGTAGTLLVAAVVVGMIYGTTFRQVKGSAARVELSEYPRLTAQTLGRIADRGIAGNAAFVGGILAERLELLTSAGVIVANYERLRPREEALGLANNIVTGLQAALVPRLLWPDKPSISDGRAFGQLYFGYPNSFAVTLPVDLLRNFGPWSIPVGMAILGLLMRALYAALVEDQPPSIWRAAAYLVVLTSVSHEASYGLIAPVVLRTGMIVMLCLSAAGWSRRWRAA